VCRRALRVLLLENAGDVALAAQDANDAKRLCIRPVHEDVVRELRNRPKADGECGRVFAQLSDQRRSCDQRAGTVDRHFYSVGGAGVVARNVSL
jgi:hypothetical protein